MFGIFKCRHPARGLAVQRESTEAISKDFPDDYTHVTYHLFCVACGEQIDITHAKPIGGVDGLMERARARHALEKKNPAVEGSARDCAADAR